LASLSTPASSSGTMLASSSTQNKDLKDQMKQDKQSSMIAKSQTVEQTQVAQQTPKEYDDRPAWAKKTQVA